MSRCRRIAVVTGSRSEYGLLRSVMRALHDHTRLELQVVATGMHLLERGGRTITHIRKDGFQIRARVPMQTERESSCAVAEALGSGVPGLARAFRRLDTDTVVVLGDRIEALAGALAASSTECVLAHIHGGDRAPGHLDDSIRHAITRLAHCHLAASPGAARRLIRMGEAADRVRVVGAPGLDDLRNVGPVPQPWWPRVGLNTDRPVALVVFHPIGRHPAVEQRVMKRILVTVARMGLACVVVHPNGDPGSSGIIRAIREVARRAKPCAFIAHASLARDTFLHCLQEAAIVVGNSSSGIIEAHSAATPVVDIGMRQHGRERNRSSVVSCGESSVEIANAVKRALARRIRTPGKSCYGSGRGGKAIVRELDRLRRSDKLMRKLIAY